MKINTNIITIDRQNQMGTQNNVNLNNLESKSSLDAGISKPIKDIVELSISGRTRSRKSIAPVRKVNTAGLIIKDLKVSTEDGEGASSYDASIITVSNEKSALGASENRLGHNTKNIDNPPKNLASK